MAKEAGNTFKRRNLSLDELTMTVLGEIAEANGYETISRAIRVLVRKYAKSELGYDPFRRQTIVAEGEGNHLERSEGLE